MPTITGLGGMATVLDLSETLTGLTNLATAYGTHTATLDVNNAEGAVFLVKYTKGSETSMEMRVSVSVDGSTFLTVPPLGDKSGALTAVAEVSKTATANFRYAVPGIPAITKIKVDVKVTSTTDATTRITVKGGLTGSRRGFVVN